MAVSMDHAHGRPPPGPCTPSPLGSVVKSASNEARATTSPEGLCIDGAVNDCPAKMLIDTGAAVTLVSDSLFAQTGMTSNDLVAPVAERDDLMGAAGASLRVMGTVMMCLSIGPANCCHRVRIVKDLLYPCIVGRDVLKHIPCHITSGDGRITFQADPAAVSLAGHSLGEVRLCDEVCIPPRHEVTIEAAVKGKHRASVSDTTAGVWIEARPNVLERFNCLVASCVVNCHSHLVPLRLLNPTNTEAVIPADICVADLREAVEICPDVSSHAQDTDNAMLEETGWVDHAADDTLWDVISLDRSFLTDEQIKQVQGVVHRHRHVFAMSSDELGHTHMAQHRIETKDARPVFQRARRLPFSKRSEARQIVDKMIHQGIVEESISPWSSPIVLVTKKDGSTRFCVDYRRLNAVTEKDPYPLPRIDDTLDALGGAQYFSTLDLCSGYHQLPMAEGDKPKTAFSTPDGHYQFKVLPFGVCNGPSAFQRLMTVVLAGLQWHKCLVYIDDIIVFGRSFDEHLLL